MKTNNKGFTLVELLAVIVILAVLLGIAMPAISNVQTSAKQGTAEDEAMTFVEAIRTCVMAEGDDTTAISACSGTDGGKAFATYMDASGSAAASVTLTGTDSSSLVVTSFKYTSSQGYIVTGSGTSAKTTGVFTLDATNGDSLSEVKNAIRSTVWG